MKSHTILAGCLTCLLAAPVAAQTPYLVSPDGTYLGNLSSNRFDPNSVNNPHGRYGSRYSSDSINNPYGKYGSRYSPYSPNNPYATSPPRIISPSPGGTGRRW
jgi:hypothetical protein